MAELFQNIAGLLLVGLGIIGAIIAVNVAIWLIEFLIKGAQSLTEFLVDQITQFLGWFLCTLGEYAITIIIALPSLIWSGMRKIILMPAKTITAYCNKWRSAWAEQYKLWELWLEHGVGNFDSFSQFKRAMNDEEETRNDDKEKVDNKTQPPKDSYSEALALFGFNQGEDFTITDFKKRYRSIISAVHPDRCHSNTLATQINAARDLIKKRRKWK